MVGTKHMSHLFVGVAARCRLFPSRIPHSARGLKQSPKFSEAISNSFARIDLKRTLDKGAHFSEDPTKVRLHGQLCRTDMLPHLNTGDSLEVFVGELDNRL